MGKALQTFWPAAVALLGATVLLCLPGKALPSGSWFDTLHLDKWVHAGMFGTLTVLWSWPFTLRSKAKDFRGAVLKVSVSLLVYGVTMEFVQHFWVPDRSFDTADIAADFAGCAIGFVASVRFLSKKVGS